MMDVFVIIKTNICICSLFRLELLTNYSVVL